MGKSIKNGDFPWLCKHLPEGIHLYPNFTNNAITENNNVGTSWYHPVNKRGN